VTHAPGGADVVADGLTRRFGAVTAVDGVSLTVAPGETFGVLGPDGAGKTTLFRMLVTLLVPDAGRAQVLGLDPVADLWALRAQLGYMPGRFSLYPDLSVEENLAFFASVFGTTPAAQAHVIAPIWRQLEPFRRRRADALSGGMKQKLALCCALVHAPRLLVLDEPTTGVDAVSRGEFWELLGRLRGEGLTILVSTPYMDEARQCDRVGFMQGGRLLQVDRPAAIEAAYPRPLVAVTGGDRLGLLAALRAHPHAAAAWPFGESIHFTDTRPEVPAAQVAAELEAWLAAAGHAARCAPIAASIEDAFIWALGQAGAA
jgi:ABC-type multidrug transport system ATPase subunit